MNLKEMEHLQMKKIVYVILIVLLSMVVTASTVLANSDLNAMSAAKNKPGCTSIQEGVLTYSSGNYLEGELLTTGFDEYGYNYQAHLFKGSYANVYLGRDGFSPFTGNSDSYLKENPNAASKWYWEFRNEKLLMKWNDTWLANTDCDGDGLLDRHYGYDSYIGSGAWETNHVSGSYEQAGKTCTWESFTKIVAVPSDAIKKDGTWYAADGAEIGPDIWGQFAIIQDLLNDPCDGVHGIQYLSPDHAGFGGW
jgi:hypothetical protein